jgi:hypothetical protein
VAGVQLKEKLSAEFCQRWTSRSAPVVPKEYFQSALLSPWQPTIKVSLKIDYWFLIKRQLLKNLR